LYRQLALVEVAASLVVGVETVFPERFHRRLDREKRSAEPIEIAGGAGFSSWSRVFIPHREEPTVTVALGGR
jgi:hypothetical protein